jgi:diaminopimelate decarboxylase
LDEQNSVIDASTWFKQFSESKQRLSEPQPVGARVGGPCCEEQDVFLRTFEGMRAVQKSSTFGDVLTAQARQGIFRYFPGVQAEVQTAAIPRLID